MTLPAPVSLWRAAKEASRPERERAGNQKSSNRPLNLPDIIRARAPLRISFGGGGTDVAPYADERGGRILNATINRYAYVTLAPNDTGTIRLRSLDYGQEVEFHVEEGPPEAHEMALAFGVVRRLLPDLDRSFALYTHTDAPPGSGLGASSTVVVALIGAFNAWLRLGLDRYEIARLAYDIEREDLGIRGGKQDQYAAAFGGFNYMEFDKGGVLVNPLRIPVEWVSELEYSLVLAWTGRSRLSSNIIESQIENFREKKSDSVQAMDETKAFADTMRQALLTKDFRRFGASLHEAWQAKKRMSDQISSSAIDELYEAAREAGALGGKISGAGGGGFMFFFTEFDRRHDVIEALEAQGAEVVHFGFTETGLQTWVR